MEKIGVMAAGGRIPFCRTYFAIASSLAVVAVLSSSRC